MTSNDRNLVTSKKPGTVLLMQNVDLGHTRVMKIRQRETLSHQGAIIHENCCSAAQFLKNHLPQSHRCDLVNNIAPILPSDGSSSNDDLHFSVKKKRRQSQGKRWVSNLLALPLFELRVTQVFGLTLIEINIFHKKIIFDHCNSSLVQLHMSRGVSSVFVRS